MWGLWGVCLGLDQGFGVLGFGTFPGIFDFSSMLHAFSCRRAVFETWFEVPGR